MTAREPFPDAYVVLTDELGQEISQRHLVRVHMHIGQPATPHDTGTIDIQVDRTVRLSYKAPRNMSVAITIGCAGGGHLIEARRVNVRTGEKADFSLIHTVKGQVVNQR